jgi:hypothetical protein
MQVCTPGWSWRMLGVIFSDTLLYFKLNRHSIVLLAYTRLYGFKISAVTNVLLMSEFSPLRKLDAKEAAKIRQSVVQLILVTDMNKHDAILKQGELLLAEKSKLDYKDERQLLGVCKL